jgi:hypothetical protein
MARCAKIVADGGGIDQIGLVSTGECASTRAATSL